MAKFGTSKYSTFKYGVATNDLAWELVVDWDRDGVYDVTNEAQYAFEMRINRGRSQMLRDDGGGFEPVRDGRMTVKLYDAARRFDPYNAASPLYPNVKPGAKFRLRVRNQNTGTYYNVMVGDIEDIRHSNADYTATITGVDRMALLRRTFFSSVLATSYTPSDIFSSVATLIGWTDSYYVDTTTSRTYPYWWIDPEKSALANLQELADSDLARFFIANDGKMTFLLRTYAPAVSFTLTGTDILRDPEISMPWDNVKNDFEIVYYPRILSPTASEEIWSMGEAYSIAGGETVIFYSHHTFNNQDAPSDNFDAMIAYTHWEANTLADGSGVDKTAFLTVTPGAVRALSRQLTVTNTSGASFYIILLRITARPTYYTHAVSRKDSSASSIASYGDQIMRIDSILSQRSQDATDMLTWLMANLITPKKSLRVRMINDYTEQFAVDLFGRVTVNLADLGINEDFAVGEIEHEWISKSGNDVLTTLRLEPAY